MLSIPKECVLCGLPRVCLHMFDARADLICIGHSRGQPGLAVCDNDRDVLEPGRNMRAPILQQDFQLPPRCRIRTAITTMAKGG